MRVLITLPQALAERALIRLDKFDVSVVPPESEDDARVFAALGNADGVLITPRTRSIATFCLARRSFAPSARTVSASITSTWLLPRSAASQSHTRRRF